MTGFEFTAQGELTRTLPPALTKGPLATPVVETPAKAEWLARLTKAVTTPFAAFAPPRPTFA